MAWKDVVSMKPYDCPHRVVEVQGIGTSIARLLDENRQLWRGLVGAGDTMHDEFSSSMIN
jgi:hypothetical protein